jgi:hypothetical protein
MKQTLPRVSVPPLYHGAVPTISMSIHSSPTCTNNAMPVTPSGDIWGLSEISVVGWSGIRCAQPNSMMRLSIAT